MEFPEVMTDQEAEELRYLYLLKWHNVPGWSAQAVAKQWFDVFQIWLSSKKKDGKSTESP